MGYNDFGSGDVEPAKKGTRLLVTVLLVVSFPLGFFLPFFWAISLFCLLFFWYDLFASANPTRNPNSSMYEKEKAEAREQYLSIAKFFIVILFISVLAMILAMTLMGVLQ